MGILKKLGVPNADALEERVKSQLGAKGMKQNPLGGAAALGRLAKSRGKLGKMEVPGELSVLVQPGTVRIAYEEGGEVALRNRGKGFIAPKLPGFEVVPEGGGEPLPVQWYERAEMPVKSGGVPAKSKCLIGEVEIPATGHYRFRAPEPVPDFEMVDGAVKRPGSLLLDAA